MINLEPGKKVAVLIDNKLSRGTIRGVYEDIKRAIVELDDGEFKKVQLSYIGIEEEETVQEEPKNEPIEKSEITITPEEFKKIAMEVIKRESKNKPLVSMGFTIFSAKLHRALFMDEGDND